MKVSGFTFIRNAVKFDYPVLEAIESILPLCDEVIVAVGKSDDDTEGLLKKLDSPKIKLIRTVWNDTLRENGAVLADETNKALAAVAADSDWLVYIQADECMSEADYGAIREAMARYEKDDRVEALLFKYIHFYGSYDYYAQSRRWYRNEIRILKNLPGITSYKDAQGFRKNGRKLNARPIDAHIYHYGWVKTPESLKNKARSFNALWHDDQWIEERYPESADFDYGNADKLYKFNGSHPRVIQPRINAVNWKFSDDILKNTPPMPLRRRILQWFEELTGHRLFEYKNYKRV